MNVVSPPSAPIQHRRRRYRLLAGSQAIDTGSVMTGLLTDCVGTVRPRSAGYDIGGFEF